MSSLLRDIADYSDSRISLDEINVETYVTTDNLLQNKQGKVSAVKMPKQASNTVTRFDKGDVLVANIRPYLKKIWLAKYTGGSSADVLTFKVKEDFDATFVYYALFRDDFFEHMMNGSKGTKMPRGDKNQILDFTIPDFDIYNQKQIAKVLSDLDDKIELNNKINTELEAMAKLIYDYWFVQFDFPDENGKPYKSSGGLMVYNGDLKKEIPNGWEVGVFKDVLDDLQSGNRPKGGIKNIENGIPSIGAENILSIGKYNYGSEKVIPEEFYSNMTKGIIKSGDVLMYKDGASLGRVSMFKNSFPYEKCCINSHAFILRSNEKITQNYLYFWLDQDFMKEIIRRAGMRAAQPGINQVNVNELVILIPDTSIIEKFESQITSSIDMIFANVLQNRKLAELRDWLLPMLMNEQVRVN